MKLASLILMMSVASLSAARAEDAGSKTLPAAQATPSKSEHQAAGACTPIGLTANGDIVFPWECRETIEKQRGPISVSVPTRLSDPPAREQSPSPDGRGEDAVATVATVQQSKADDTAERLVSTPEANAAPTQLKSRLLPKRASNAGRQHTALQSHQVSGSAANAKTKDRVALRPGAGQK